MKFSLRRRLTAQVVLVDGHCVAFDFVVLIHDQLEFGNVILCVFRRIVIAEFSCSQTKTDMVCIHTCTYLINARHFVANLALRK